MGLVAGLGQFTHGAEEELRMLRVRGKRLRKTLKEEEERTKLYIYHTSQLSRTIYCTIKVKTGITDILANSELNARNLIRCK